jgi:hypothetical protein
MWEVEILLSAGPPFEAVVANHLETDRPFLLEGDYLLPELSALD